MKSFAEIIDRWPSLRDFANDLDIPYTTAGSMKSRDAINPVYWPRIVASAKARGIRGVTYERLVAAYATRYEAPAVGNLTAA